MDSALNLPQLEIRWSFARSGGPGGQNVNKVASKAELRWDVVNSPSLPAEVKSRFLVLFGSRITVDGELIIISQRYRDQGRNREDCLAKLRAMMRQAATAPRPRKATKPTRASKLNRLRAKKRRSETKKSRGRPSLD
jgi:ribosome-associated protein